MTSDERFHRQASDWVLRDLIDCLFAEGCLEGVEHELLTLEEVGAFCSRYGELPAHSLIWRWWISREPLLCVLVPMAKDIVQPLRAIQGTRVFAVTAEGRGELRADPLDAVGFMELVVAHAPDGVFVRNREGSALFLEWLRESVRQTAWSLANDIDAQGLLSRSPTDLFRVLEQCASLRDRPFHPVAKAKMGFGRQDYVQYMAEFGRDIHLCWVAVDRRSLEYGTGVSDPWRVQPARFVLTQEQQEALSRELRQRALLESHVALPVHPWHMHHVLPKQLGTELQSGVCTPLDLREGVFRSTSSVRSLMPTRGGANHLKLPLGIHSLGASRYLPAIKMINGQRSEGLLRRAITLDCVLNRSVFVCDETKWWAYMPPGGSLFDEAPRHLSAMVRSYPVQLIQDPACRLIPMSALGTSLPGGQRHFFDEWLQYRQLPPEHPAVLMLFEETCETFFEINLRMFRLGMLAEVHGQNAMLVWRNGHVCGLAFRDHDSLRVHVPWLLCNGLADPEYRLKAGHPNTLYHDTPEDLLFYLQTLAIHVNVRAIIEALALCYGIAEGTLWRVLHEVLVRAIDRAELPDHVREVVHRSLFREERWPLKLLIRPMIERAGGPGSMPFGKGSIQKPFQHVGPPV